MQEPVGRPMPLVSKQAVIYLVPTVVITFIPLFTVLRHRLLRERIPNKKSQWANWLFFIAGAMMWMDNVLQVVLAVVENSSKYRKMDEALALATPFENVVCFPAPPSPRWICWSSLIGVEDEVHTRLHGGAGALAPPSRDPSRVLPPPQGDCAVEGIRLVCCRAVRDLRRGEHCIPPDDL